MKRSKFVPILIIVLSINFLTLGLLMIMDRNCVCSPVKQYEEKVVEKVVPASGNLIDSLGQSQKIFLYGTIKKEKIPEELELGDNWYWIYFNEPHLLVNNSSGVPIYIDKMQLNSPENEDFYNIDDYLDKNVEIYGYQTWGYAESSVFQPEAIREY